MMRIENMNRAWVYRLGVEGRVIPLVRVYDVDADSLREAIRILRAQPGCGNRRAHRLVFFSSRRRR